MELELELVDSSDTRTTMNSPTAGSIALSLQGPDSAAVATSDVWREDVLVIRGTSYLVLNLGMMYRRAPGVIKDVDGETRPVSFWAPSGLAVLELQAIDAEGRGIAQPTMIQCELPDDGDNRFVVSLMQAELRPVSPRRPQ